MTGGLAELLLAAFVFVGTHAVSSTPLRAGLVARMGRGPFLVLFALVSIAALGWFVSAFIRAPVVLLWPQAPWTRLVPLFVMPLASILLVAGLFTANATVMTDGKLPQGANPAPGILKVTRHPVMWAIGLWAAAHMAPNGNVAALIFFGTLLALCAAGMRLLDAKHARVHGAAWARFAAATSALPFAATLEGRNRVSLNDIGWIKIAGGLALYSALLLLHHTVIGKSPWPGLGGP
ncbi:MAG: NnrU family protein [Alphaproteobacteria bacterium]